LKLQLHTQLVPITTNVVSSNPVDGDVYSKQYFVIKFVSDLWQVGGFLRILRFTSTNKTDCHELAEIVLKVALNTMTIILS
jgi:hypothetical protein